MSNKIVNENFVEIRIRNRRIQALVDSGSTSSIINAELLQQLHLEHRPLGRNERTVLFSASNDQLPVVGIANICLSFSDHTHCLFVSHEFKVVPGVSHNVILGMDFLRQNKIIIDCDKIVMILTDSLLQVPMSSRRDQQLQALAVSSVCLPPNSESFVQIKCPRQFNNRTVLVEGLPGVQFKDFAAARSFNSCKNGRAWVKVLNFKSIAKVLSRGQPIARIQSLGSVASCSLFKEPKESAKNDKAEKFESS